MSAETIIGILFRLINFGVFIGLGVRYFKRSVSSNLKQSMLDQQEMQQALRVRELDLHNHFRELDRQIQEQDTLCHQFQARVHQWNLALEEHKAVREHEKQKISQQLHERSRMQQQALEQSYAVRVIAPDVIERMHQETLKTFSDSTYAQQYLDVLAQRLNKERA